MLLNNLWIKERIMKKIRKYLKTNGTENTTYQTMQDGVKAGLRGKFVGTNDCINNKDLKGPRKRRINQTQNYQKEIIKIRDK